MSRAEFVIVVAVALVTAWLGRRAAPRAQLVVWCSALLVSAAMFLPMGDLRSLVPPGLLRWVEARLAEQSWTLPDLAHLVAFAWLAMVLWFLRPDLRGWRVVGTLWVLAMSLELLQGLTVDREMHLGDVAINLVGAAAGLLLAVAVSALWRALRAPRIDQA